MPGCTVASVIRLPWNPAPHPAQVTLYISQISPIIILLHLLYKHLGKVITKWDRAGGHLAGASQCFLQFPVRSRIVNICFPFALVQLDYFMCTLTMVKWLIQQEQLLPLHCRVLPLFTVLSAKFWRWPWILSISFSIQSVTQALYLPLLSACQKCQCSRKGICTVSAPSR